MGEREEVGGYSVEAPSRHINRQLSNGQEFVANKPARVAGQRWQWRVGQDRKCVAAWPVARCKLLDAVAGMKEWSTLSTSHIMLKLASTFGSDLDFDSDADSDSGRWTLDGRRWLGCQDMRPALERVI